MRSGQQISSSGLLGLAEKFASQKKRKKKKKTKNRKKRILKMDLHLVSGRLVGGMLEGSTGFTGVPSVKD